MRLPLTSFDQVPEKFYEFVHVEFTMPSTTVSHAVVRSVSVSSEEPPEKYVRYVAKYEMKVGLSVSFQYEENEYAAAVSVTNPARKPSVVEDKPAEKAPQEEEEEDSDSE